jgi:hypothetical protein
MRKAKAFWVAVLGAFVKVVISVSFGVLISENLMLVTLFLGVGIESMLQTMWPVIGEDRANQFLAAVVSDFVAVWLLIFLILLFKKSPSPNLPRDGTPK